MVYVIDSGAVAPEVAAQIDGSSVRILPRRELRVKPFEYLRLRLPELIYALLDVAYPEHVVRSGNAANEMFLYVICILVFIYKDELEALSEYLRHLVIFQYADRYMLHVREVYHPVLKLLCFISFLEFLKHFKVIDRISVGRVQFTETRLKIRHQISVPEITDLILKAFIEAGYFCFYCFIGFLLILLCTKPCRRYVVDRAEYFRVEPALFQHCDDLLYGSHLEGELLIEHLRYAGLIHHGLQPAVTVHDPLERVKSICPHDILQLRPLESIRCHLQLLRPAICPLEVIRHGPQLSIRTQKVVHELLFGTLLAVQSQKRPEAASLDKVVAGKAIIHHFAHGLAPQKLALDIIRDREVRLHVYLMKEFLYDTQGKTVDGRYIRPVQPAKLILHA